jgi:co-chaperonin GroES (HSP10)
MAFAPVNKYIVVQKVAKAATSPGGIILSAASEETDRCVVLSVSDQVVCVDVGDTLLVRWNNALKIEKDVYAVEEKDIVTRLIN